MLIMGGNIAGVYNLDKSKETSVTSDTQSDVHTHKCLVS